jgi:hypothetical protein
VLKEMGKTGAALFFVFRTDVIPDVDRYQRNGVILMEYDVESVGQGDFLRGYRNHQSKPFPLD